jgi:hypothetical protein
MSWPVPPSKDRYVNGQKACPQARHRSEVVLDSSKPVVVWNNMITKFCVFEALINLALLFVGQALGIPVKELHYVTNESQGGWKHESWKGGFDLFCFAHLLP